MSQSKMRIFTVDDIQYSFSSMSFRSVFDRYAKENKITKGRNAENLRKWVNVSVDAVNNWKYGKNGPADMETIKNIAEYLHVDWQLLMIKTNGGNTMTKLTERQKDAAKRIYDVLIRFLEEFNNTDGFKSWYLDFKEQGSQNPEDDTYERIKQMEEQAGLVLEQEYFDLHDHEIYDAFCEFFGEELQNLYERKDGYACCFEADGESDPAVWRDYEIARQHLNEIVERYI